ncbi:MAG: M48 family metalloprotease, partial [Armatimonadota bacterium]|nr:M48 family metalloprotease [Armatimonadota bacterium]
MKPGLLTILLCLAWAIPTFADPPDVFPAPATLSARDKAQAADEAKQGADASAEVNKTVKLVTDKAVLDRVNSIGQKLAAVANVTTYKALYGNDKTFPFTWHFFVIKEKDVNAFSLPGGYVYVNEGLLKFVRTDDELAGVLAHEITHAAHHHIQSLSHEQAKMNTEMIGGLLAAIVMHMSPRDIANLAAGAQYTQMGILNTRYSQAAERDADNGGAILMQKAGYNPVAMLTFMQRLADIEARSPKIEMGILMDHPYTAERVGLI